MEPTKTIPALQPAVPDAPHTAFIPQGEVMLNHLRELTHEIHSRAADWDDRKDSTAF